MTIYLNVYFLLNSKSKVGGTHKQKITLKGENKGEFFKGIN